MNQPTEICITVDTEFSIGGAFADPERNRPVGEDRVHCPVDGHDQGLGFILRTLSAYGQQATFFVETVNVAYFGDLPMGRVVDVLLESGQDVQLHLHPHWQVFAHDDWPDRVRNGPPNDLCANLEIDRLSALMTEGIDTFQRWGAPRPMALRTGNLSAGRTVYQVMHEVGVPLASNIAAGYAPPAESSLRLMGGLHRINGVVEAPVLSYAQLRLGAWSKLRMLAITAASWPETRALLMAARRSGLSPIIILTHPFEFIKETGKSGDRPNHVNQRRLQKLCAFIAENPDDFTMATFGRQGRNWLEGEARAAPLLTAPLNAVIGRVMANAMNDRVSFL
ncbi:MAG: polysaccharide deacetylase [Pseudomonadota bacterium]